MLDHCDGNQGILIGQSGKPGEKKINRPPLCGGSPPGYSGGHTQDRNGDSRAAHLGCLAA